MAFKSITDESWARVCLLISQGHHKRAACGAAGVSMPTFYRYRQLALQARAERQARDLAALVTEPVSTTEPELRLAQLEAAEAADMIYLENVVRKTVQGAMFLLQRRYPDAYGDPDSGVTVDHMETIIRTLEAIREGALAYHEIADTLGEHLATRLFRSAGVDIAGPSGTQ
jgi:hypothetical protein